MFRPTDDRHADAGDASWSADAVRPVVHEVLDLFGAERCVLGSNHPVDSIGGASSDDVSDALGQLVAELSDAEQVALPHATAARTYRLGTT